MPGPKPRPPLTRETLRRMADEQLGLTLSDENLDALLPLVDALWKEAAMVPLVPAEGPEPGPLFEMEPWTDA